MASDIRVKLPLVMSITTAAKSDDATATTASIASATVTGRFNRRIIRASILSASEHLARIEIQDDILAPFFLVARRQLERHCLEDGAPRRFGGGAKIGRAHVCTPVTNAHLVCRLLLEHKKPAQPLPITRTAPEYIN